MTWFKVDDGLHSSRKVLSIPKRHRFAALGLWTLAGSWCAHELNDGVVPDYMLKEWGATETTVLALVNAGLWEASEKGYTFYAWHEYQPSKAQTEARRDANKARMQAARAAGSKQKPRDSGANEDLCANTSAHATQSVSHPRPDPTLTEPKGSGADDAEVIEDTPPASTQTLIAEWLENNQTRPPQQLIGQLSKQIKTLLDEGQPYPDVRNAVIAWHTKGLHPSTLPSVLHEIRNKRSSTDKRVDAGRAMFDRVTTRAPKPQLKELF